MDDLEIEFEALLVQAPGHAIRVILEGCCLDFHQDDVLGIEELPPPPGLVEGSAIPARLKLRANSRLLRAAPAEPYRNILWNRRVPFVFATRPVAVECDATLLETRQAAFFAARGIKRSSP